MGFRGTIYPNYDWFAWVVRDGWGFTAGSGSAAGWGNAAGMNSTQGLELAAGVEHAPGEAGYPCQSKIIERRQSKTFTLWTHFTEDTQRRI